MINLLTGEKMNNIIKVIILAIFFQFSNQVHISTTSGIVMGKKTQIQGRCVHEYLGIPYAKPPVGELRFKNPEPISNYYRVLTTTSKGSTCIQKEIIPIPPINEKMSEDCLYLNVWVPVCPMEKKPLTTMISIHGGVFLTGSGNDEQSDGGIISSIGCVIVISFSYRVGVFGFLNLNTDEAPGNMGMMDQVLLLKWVNKNIAAFGGDPNQVTLFGHSAGGISIALHLISPLTKDLFNRVIIQSPNMNSDINVFVAENPSHNIEISEIIATRIGCNQANPEDKVTCLRKVDPITLASVLKDYIESIPTLKGLLPQISGPYLPDGDNINIHCADVIIGNVRDKGSILLKIFYPEFEKQENPTLTKAEGKRVIEKYYKAFDLSQEDKEKIYNKYLGYLPNEDSTRIVKQTSKALGEGTFICPSYFLTKQLSEFMRQSCNCNHVRYFIFNHDRILCDLPEWEGVTYKEEVPFVLGRPFKDLDCYTPEEACLSRRIILYWTTYAKTGNPTYSCQMGGWPPFDEDAYSVEIQLTNSIVLKDPLKEICDFWNEIYDSGFFKP